MDVRTVDHGADRRVDRGRDDLVGTVCVAGERERERVAQPEHAAHLVQRVDRIGGDHRERPPVHHEPHPPPRTVLGGAFTSRLNHLIREVRGYTYGIRGDFASSRRFGRFAVSSGVQTAVTAPALVESVGEISRTQLTGVTEDELEVARSWRAGQLSVELQSPRAIAAALSTLVVHDLPDDYHARLREQLLAATVEDVSAAAATYLHPESLTMVIEGDAAVIRDELVASGLGEVVDHT